MPIILYLWWILSNGIITYFSIVFFLCTIQINDRKHIPILLTIHVVLTAVITRLQIEGTFWLEVLLLIIYAVIFLKMKIQNMLAPIAILFTLRTFVEGFTAVLTAYVATHLKISFDSTFMQIFLSLSLDMVFLLSLWLIQKRFLFSLQKTISSYLYTLLLPCILMVLMIRYGLRLDSSIFQQYLSSFGVEVSLTALFMMLGAAIVFFIMIEIFCKIIQLAEHETAVTLLTSQLAGQQIYINEARKRNEQYASFQHDIKNHLLVLSGLIQEAKYGAARQYVNQLHACCQSLSIPISTGNFILDTLLKEKLSHAQRSEIQVVYKVQIPSDFHINDMDLCVVFSNILDNAITACMQVEKQKRFLHISTKARANFLVIESANSVAISQPIQMGIGLKNIKNIAKKYQGITEIENADGTFRISVLLCSLNNKG